MPRIQDMEHLCRRESELAKLVPQVPRIAVGMGTCGRGMAPKVFTRLRRRTITAAG